MKWRPIDDHSINSNCGRYRISKGLSGPTMVYHLWSTLAHGSEFKSGTSGWHHVSAHRDPGGRDSALEAASRHRALADE